jgi:ABC-type glycerol-3-phosphate transport system substrate-binding protein
LSKVDAQDNVLFRKSVTDQIQIQQIDLQYVGLDRDNRIYITSMDQVFLFDADGTYHGEVTISNDSVYILALGQGADGKVYIQYPSESKLLTGQIDFEAQKQAVPFESAVSSVNANLSIGLTGDLLLNSGTFLYDYTVETQTGRKIMVWAECNISSSDVAYCAPLSDGRIAAILIGDSGTAKEAELVFLEKKRKTDTTEKQELVLASLSVNTFSSLMDDVVAFNRQSDRYKIVVKDYHAIEDWQSARTRFQIDLTTSEIDIVNLDSIVEVSAYAHAGVFEDLTPYLESSKTLRKEDIVPAVLQGRTFEERLVSIPTSFSLKFYIARNEAISDKTFLYPRDLLDLMQQYPDYQLFNITNKEYLVYEYLSVYGYDFLDWETGKCHFDSVEFIEFLAFLKELPEQSERGDGFDQSSEYYANTKVMFARAGFSSLMEYKFLMTNLGDADVSFIRGPGISDNPGTELFSSGGDYAISTGSKHKDAAWAFIEFVHSRDQRDYLPTNIVKLDEMLAKEVTGEVSGTPSMESPWEGSISARHMSDGETMWIYPITQEDVDGLKKLIDGAKIIERNYGMNQEIWTIMYEEIQAYLADDKTAEETAAIIQNRIQLMMHEMQ